MRVKETTLKLIRMYAGELQLESGDTISDNDALLAIFERHRPDLVERAEKKQESERPAKAKAQTE